MDIILWCWNPDYWGGYLDEWGADRCSEKYRVNANNVKFGNASYRLSERLDLSCPLRCVRCVL